MIIAVASRKASPGATTLTTLLAGYWSEPDALRVIIEADVSGGTLAARWNAAHNLSWDPGLLAMSATRGQLDIESLTRVTQPLTDDVVVAAAPPRPGQIAAALTALGDKGAARLAGASGVRAFVDCGRLGTASPAITLARRAALTIVVCRPILEEIHALQPGIGELHDAGCVVGLVCIGEGDYHPTEIAESCQTELVGVIPEDQRAAHALNRDGFAAGRVFAKSVLAKRVAELTTSVQARCAEVVVPHVAASDTSHIDEQSSAGREPGEPRADRVGFASLVEQGTTAPDSADGTSTEKVP